MASELWLAKETGRHTWAPALFLPLALSSPFMCGSCVTRRDSSKWGTCSSATPSVKSVKKILGLQQRNKVALLEVDTKEFFLEEVT